MRRQKRFPALLGNRHQRMNVRLEIAPFLLELAGDILANQTVGRQGVDHFGQGQAVVLGQGLFHMKSRR